MDLQSLDPSYYDVSAVGGTMPTTLFPAPHLDGPLDGIAQQLSTTPDALRNALSQGSSITDLAQQQGVSRDDLVKSVEDQIQQTRAANGAQPLDQQSLDRMVNRAFDRHRGGHHHHHSKPASSAASTAPTDPQPPSGGIDVLA
jgi:hypothetical protein